MVAVGSDPAAACCLASTIRRSTRPAARSSEGRMPPGARGSGWWDFACYTLAIGARFSDSAGVSYGNNAGLVV